MVIALSDRSCSKRSQLEKRLAVFCSILNSLIPRVSVIPFVYLYISSSSHCDHGDGSETKCKLTPGGLVERYCSDWLHRTYSGAYIFLHVLYLSADRMQRSSVRQIAACRGSLVQTRSLDNNNDFSIKWSTFTRAIKGNPNALQFSSDGKTVHSIRGHIYNGN